LIAGQVQIRIGSGGAVAPHVKTGKLRALAVASAQPSALFPGLPTVAATLPGYESGSPFAMYAPAKTPATLINRLNREVVKVLGQTDVKEKFFNLGSETVGSSPEQLGAAMKSEITRMRKVIKDADIRLD
jgi:tripartite-type tricarboxylate transporter receptor subunit TctC